MKKLFVRTMLFVIPVLIGIQIIKRVFPEEFSNKIYQAKLRLFQNGPGFNTVFFGSSRTHSHIDPAVFDKAFSGMKISSFNFGIRGAYNPEAYVLASTFLKSKYSDSVDYLLLEIQPFDHLGNMHHYKGAVYLADPDLYGLAMGQIWNTEYSVYKKARLSYRYSAGFISEQFDLSGLPIGKESNSTYKDSLTLKNGYAPLLYQSESSRAYQKDTSDFADSKGYYQATASIAGNDNKAHGTYLARLEELAKAKGIEIYYIIPTHCQNYAFAQEVSSSISEDRILVGPELTTSKDLSLSRFAYDKNHLNPAGAQIFSSALGEEFKARLLKNRK